MDRCALLVVAGLVGCAMSHEVGGDVGPAPGCVAPYSPPAGVPIVQTITTMCGPSNTIVEGWPLGAHNIMEGRTTLVDGTSGVMCVCASHCAADDCYPHLGVEMDCVPGLPALVPAAPLCVKRCESDGDCAEVEGWRCVEAPEDWKRDYPLDRVCASFSE